jgi:hypothetical protein
MSGEPPAGLGALLQQAHELQQAQMQRGAGPPGGLLGGWPNRS